MLRVLKWGLFAGLLLGGMLWIAPARETVLQPLAEWLDVGDNPVCVNYVVVLPGDEANRTLTAAALVRAGLAHEVLIPQNPHSADVKDGMIPPTAQLSRRILGHRGIPDDRIGLIGSASRTTFDDAQALAEFLGNQNAKVALVTSGFHTRRTRFTFRKVFGESAERITIVAAPNPGFRTRQWWQHREGMRLILTEYLKLGFYYVRYGGIPLWAGMAVLIGCLTGWRILITRRRRIHESNTENQPQESGDAAQGRDAAMTS